MTKFYLLPIIAILFIATSLAQSKRPGTDTMSKADQVPEVKICNMIWMVKNLDVCTYRNGDVIPQVTDSAKWVNITKGAWCW